MALAVGSRLGPYDLIDFGYTPRYDVAPDGQSFSMISDTELPRLTRINVVLNWFEELKRLVPTK